MTAFIFGIIFALVIGAVGGFILAMHVMDEAEKEKKGKAFECGAKCDKPDCTCACHQNCEREETETAES